MAASAAMPRLVIRVGVETNGGEVVAAAYSSGKASIGARVGYVVAARRRRSVSALLQAPASVFRGSAVSGGRRVAGTRVFSAGCSRLPQGGSSTGLGGWAERASRPRGRRGFADGRLTVPVAIGSIIGSYEQSWQVGGLGEGAQTLGAALLGDGVRGHSGSAKAMSSPR